MNGRPQDIIERALGLSRADGCMVILDDETAGNLRWANSSLTTCGVSATRRVTVIATAGRAGGVGVGVRSVSGAVDGQLEDLVAAAEHTARQAAPAPDAHELAPAGAVPPSWDDAVPTTSAAAFAAVIPELAAAFTVAGGREQSLFGYVEHRLRTTFLGSSTGLRLRHDQPAGHVELTGRHADGGSAWVGVPSRDLTDVAIGPLCERLHERLGRPWRRITLPPGRYECVLPPAAVADLMSYVYWSAGARDAAAGQTVYSRAGGGTRVGDRLTEVPVTLRGDPGAPGLRCAPFVLAHASDPVLSVFDNGLPLRPTSWVRAGRLDALLQTRHTAAQTGLPLTPHIDNLILEAPGPGGTIEDLIAATDHGLLVTSLWYIREVDQRSLLLTGLTRDGVYLVDQGEIVGEVGNFRFNESPVGLLGRIRQVGTTVPTRPREWGDAFTAMAMPPLRVADFTMSSVSRAT